MGGSLFRMSLILTGPFNHMAINGSPNGMTSNIYSDTPPPPIRHGVGKFEFIIGKSKVLKMS